LVAGDYALPVTVLMKRIEGTPEAAAGSPRRRLVLWILPWLVPAAAWVLGLIQTGTPVGDIALYAAYLAVAIVLPGTLAHRALRGSRGNLPDDIAWGTATGLLLLLVGWAIGAAARLQAVLWVWPLLIIALFLAVPRLRRHWRIPREERSPLPIVWSWLFAAVACLVIAVGYPFWRTNPLPPATTNYYQDLMYHLALVHEMTRSIPFHVPQLSEDTLRYTYLADSDMAAASMITKISPAVVLLRLWIVPICLAGALVFGALARELTGKWWAGPLGGAAALFAEPLVMGSATHAFAGSPLPVNSPSQLYALPLLGLLVGVSVDVLRGKGLGWAWVIVFPLALACQGAKSSALPPLVAGLALAALVVLVRQRDRLLPTMALLVLTLAAMGVGFKIFAGGGASTLALQPFAVLYFVAPYRQTLGLHDTNDGTLSLPLGVQYASTGGLIFIAGLVVWWIVAQSPRMLGLLALTRPNTRREPAAWLLAGITIAGTGAVWLLWHPSASELYFFLCAAPFASLLTVWLLADLKRGWRPVIAGLVVGAVWAEAAPRFSEPRHPTVNAWAWALAEPFLISAGAAVVVALIALGVGRAVTGRFAWRALPAGLVAAVLGASFAGAIEGYARASYVGLVHPNPGRTSTRAITSDEMRAALWLGDHSGADDLIATNVHCASLTSKNACDARAFWVVGLSGRRSLVESWGYTDQAVAANGVGGKSYPLQPAPYPAQFALNQRAFTKGDPADVDRLKTEFHVRWLFADSRAQGGVSPRLPQDAHLVYRAGTASVYQLY
jgi:hypothetical protein